MVIYTLCDSGAPGIIRYVGKSVNAEARLKQHTKDLDGKQHRKNWIRSVLSAGRMIEQTIIAFAATDDEANRLECYYIKLFRDLGFDLTNSTDGGDGVTGYRYSDEQKREIGLRSKAAWKAGAHTPESIAATAAAHRGSKRSEKICANISASKLGKLIAPCSEARKKKISDTLRGSSRPWTSITNKTPWTNERRANASAAQRLRQEKIRNLKLVSNG